MGTRKAQPPTFEEFIQAGLYLRGWSEKTPPIYRRAFSSFQQFTGQTAPSKPHLEAWVVGMRQRGPSPAGCNIYIRAMNAYCSWLREQGVLKDQLKLKQIKNHPKPITPFSEKEIRLLMANRPKRLSYLRTWILIVLMLDTGCRIDEVLTLRKPAIDFDNLLLTVNGKGGKIRRIPFSPEMRKHLWRYCQQLAPSAAGLNVFNTRNATQLTYRNAYRGIKGCFGVLGSAGPHVHPHNLRHTFTCNFVKRGGNLFTLSRILGH